MRTWLWIYLNLSFHFLTTQHVRQKKEGLLHWDSNQQNRIECLSNGRRIPGNPLHFLCPSFHFSCFEFVLFTGEWFFVLQFGTKHVVVWRAGQQALPCSSWKGWTHWDPCPFLLRCLWKRRIGDPCFRLYQTFASISTNLSPPSDLSAPPRCTVTAAAKYLYLCGLFSSSPVSSLTYFYWEKFCQGPRLRTPGKDSLLAFICKSTLRNRRNWFSFPWCVMDGWNFPANAESCWSLMIDGQNKTAANTTPCKIEKGWSVILLCVSQFFVPTQTIVDHTCECFFPFSLTTANIVYLTTPRAPCGQLQTINLWPHFQSNRFVRGSAAKEGVLGLPILESASWVHKPEDWLMAKRQIIEQIMKRLWREFPRMRKWPIDWVWCSDLCEV